MGGKRFATLSDGSFIQPLNSFKKSAEKLASLQRKLKHKKKYSKNWLKQKAKITTHHEKIANARRDFLHKQSTQLSENQAIIVIEDLKIKNMSKAAKLKNVKQKSSLNKSILDQGWGTFFEMLQHKQDWNGGQLIRVNPQYTSQQCPRCHHVAKDNRLTQESFVCVEYGYTENADFVGAMNVLTRGLSGASL